MSFSAEAVALGVGRPCRAGGRRPWHYRLVYPGLVVVAAVARPAGWMGETPGVPGSGSTPAERTRTSAPPLTAPTGPVTTPVTGLPVLRVELVVPGGSFG